MHSSGAATIVALLSLASTPARASGLDLTRWLDRPGVKLVAVELYATWCKPCMAAVPRWKALHEKYRDRGLRLVVIATQDPKAGCANPGWNPDEVVCDDDGSIARSLGAGDALPAAFLWSWRGEKLVSAGHVDEVERAIEAWLPRAPRVAVEAGVVDAAAGVSSEALRDLVRARVRDEGKLEVIATAAERAKLDRLKASSLSARYDDRAQCELGKELPANALLEASITRRGGKQRLHLSLLSAERGCLVAGTVLDWRSKDARATVAEAVAEVLQKVRVASGDPAPAGVVPVAAAQGGIRVQVPEIKITSASGLSEINLEAERLLEKAQDAQEDPQASFSAKADAWCALEKLRGKNPYKKDAKAACVKWKRFVEEHRAQQEKLAKDYEALSGLLQLKRRSDSERRAALDAFLAAYGALDDPRVRLAAGLRRAWPLAVEQVAQRLDRSWPARRLALIGSPPQRTAPVQPRRVTTRGKDWFSQANYVIDDRGLPLRIDQTGTYPTTTHYEYDADGKLLKTTVDAPKSSAGKLVTTYEYAPGAELPHRSTDRYEKGPPVERRYHRDARGALTKLETIGGSTPSTTTYTLDAEGYEQSSVYDGGGSYRVHCTTTYGPRTRTWSCSGSSSYGSTYHLDDSGRVTRVVSFDGTEITYEY